MRNNNFLIVVYLDTDGANQFPLIKGICNTTGGIIDVSVRKFCYRFIGMFDTIPEGAFGFELIDINGRHLFTPWSIIKDGYCEFGFLINPNYVTLNGITF